LVNAHGAPAAPGGVQPQCRVIGKYVERRDEKLARLGAAPPRGPASKPRLQAFIAAAAISIAFRRRSRLFDVHRVDSTFKQTPIAHLVVKSHAVQTNWGNMRGS
jgi:hypothetical protein